MNRIHETLLTNGLKVLVVPNPVVDIVSFRFFVRSGAREQTLPGIAHLVGALLTKGSERHSSLELAGKVEALGAFLGADSNPDYMLVSAKSLGEDFPTVLALAAELLHGAIFPEAELELERRVTLQALRSQQERPVTVAYNQLRAALYGDHPYAFSDLGTEWGVGSLTREDLNAFYRTHFRPDNTVFVAVGPLEPERVLRLIEEHLGAWSAPHAPLLRRPLLEGSLGRSQKLRQVQPTQQSTVMIGYEAAAVRSEDFPALKLIGAYLGNGLSSRLFTELREKRGLAYEVSAFYPTRLDRSHFVAYIGTAPDNTRTCEEGLRFETERLAEAALCDEEVETARSKLLGQYALGKQTNSQIAQLLGWYEALGLGVGFDEEYIRTLGAVAATDLREVARRYFHSPVVSLVGPEQALAIV
jgi:predicted Zn-dependent peptidase